MKMMNKANILLNQIRIVIRVERRVLTMRVRKEVINQEVENDVIYIY